MFIGAQAANWNDARQTDANAAMFTEHLTSDLRTEAWRYELQVRYWSWQC